MEVFEAIYDYTKQRNDVLSFRKGDQFYIIDKPNSEWWSARRLNDNTFGYVPSVYLEKCKEQFIGRLVPEGRRNTREHDIHLQALAELHQRVKPLPAHVLGQALGVDVPKEHPPPAPHHSSNQRQKILIPEFQMDDEEPTGRLTSPSPPLISSSRSPRNSFKGPTSTAHRARSPSPLPPPKPKSRNGSFRHEEDSLPYHHQCNAAADWEEEDDEDELPAHLRTTPPPPVSSPPPPDYDLDDDDDTLNGVPYHHRLNHSGRAEPGRFIEVIEENLGDGGPQNMMAPPTMAPTQPPPGSMFLGRVDEDGLIHPKPLHNPVKNSPVHKSLHRELKTRSKYLSPEQHGPVAASGRKVLNQDNELKKVFRDRSQRQTKKTMDAEKESRRTSFDIKLQERLKLGEEESFQNLEALEKAAREPEFMKVQLKPRSGSGKT